MKVIKKQQAKTYKAKNGKEYHYYSYYLETENGKRILIKPVDNKDYAKLDMVSTYEPNKNQK